MNSGGAQRVAPRHAPMMSAIPLNTIAIQAIIRNPYYIQTFPVWQQETGINGARCFVLIEVQSGGVEYTLNAAFVFPARPFPWAGACPPPSGLCWNLKQNRKEENK